jgi:Cft2 family RNA processing exonuclease
VHYISFSAHADFIQTSQFIEELKPSHIVLVHGERNMMASLKRQLVSKYENQSGVQGVPVCMYVFMHACVCV